MVDVHTSSLGDSGGAGSSPESSPHTVPGVVRSLDLYRFTISHLKDQGVSGRFSGDGERVGRGRRRGEGC